MIAKDVKRMASRVAMALTPLLIIVVATIGKMLTAAEYVKLRFLRRGGKDLEKIFLLSTYHLQRN